MHLKICHLNLAPIIAVLLSACAHKPCDPKSGHPPIHPLPMQNGGATYTSSDIEGGSYANGRVVVVLASGAQDPYRTRWGIKKGSVPSVITYEAQTPRPYNPMWKAPAGNYYIAFKATGANKPAPLKIPVERNRETKVTVTYTR